MFLYFDKEGTLKTKIDHGEKLRQGGDMNVTVCLDTDFWSSKKRGDYSLELNALLMTLVFPDETKSISQTADSVSERVFEKLYDSEIVYDLVPGKTYLMYDFFFSAESATPYFGKLRINLTAGNSITTNDYVRFGDESEWISSDPILASGEAGIAKSCDSDGNCTYISKIGKDGLHFTALGDAGVQTSELDPVLPPEEGSGYGNYWINTINKTVWLYNESLSAWTQVITFGVNDKTIEPVTIAFATTEAYVEKTIGFAKAQIDQQISIKYNDIMARFKDVYSKLGMALIKPDWNQQESGKQSYIFNKPNIKNTDVSHIDNLGEETGLFFVKNDSGSANPVYDDYILFQYAGKHQIVWREVSVSFGRTKFGDTWSEWQKNNAEGSLTGNTAPTGELAGVLGQLYLKKDTKDLYYCAKDTEPYEWIPLSKVIKSISTIDSQAGYSEAKGITVQSNEKILYADNSESEAIQTTRDIPVKMGRGIKVKQSDVDPNVIEIYTDLEAKLNENIFKNPEKTYLVWKGNTFPNSSGATFKAPAGCTIDWGDGTVETFETESTTVNTHSYTDGIGYHLIVMDISTICETAFRACRNLISIYIGSQIYSIGVAAFSACINLSEIEFAQDISLYAINSFTFDDVGVTNLKIPNSTRYIESYGISQCKKLTNLTLGTGIYSIKDHLNTSSFYTGPDFTLRMLATEPPALSSNAFSPKLTKIIVPKSAINAYKSAAVWSTYADKIVYEVDSSDIDKAITDLDVDNIAYKNKDNTFTSRQRFNKAVSLNEYIALRGSNDEYGTYDLRIEPASPKSRYKQPYIEISTGPAYGGGTEVPILFNKDILFPTKSGTLALIEDLTAKLDKPTVADSNYKIVTYNGTNSGTLDYSNAPNASSIMQRDADGRAQVVSGVSGNDIVNYSQLETKYDKTGGTIGGNVVITGDLTVNGTQHINNTENLNVENAMIYSNAKGATLATNGGIGIKKNATDVYGIVYDPTSDSVKLGIGKSDANGRFTFNANEGQPVAIRDDSSKFTNNNLVKWDSESYKFVDAGKNVENLVDKLPASLRSQAYVRNANGEDSGLAYTYTDESNSLALRNASGQLQVSTPSQDNDAANKKFVEDAIAVEVETSLMGA